MNNHKIFESGNPFLKNFHHFRYSKKFKSDKSSSIPCPSVKFSFEKNAKKRKLMSQDFYSLKKDDLHE